MDSGAMRCLFNIDFGNKLGIDVKSASPSLGRSASGLMQIFYHRIIVQILNRKFPCRVGFSAEYENEAFGLLGHEGIFDKLKRVTFNTRKKFVDLVEL